MSFDDYGNELSRCEIRTSDGLSDCQKCSYDYDSHHNWIKRNCNPSDNKTELTIRTITYY
jgi:hypothetical protein